MSDSWPMTTEEVNEIRLEDHKEEIEKLREENKSLSGLLTAAVGDYNDELEKVKELERLKQRIAELDEIIRGYKELIRYHESLGNRME